MARRRIAWTIPTAKLTFPVDDDAIAGLVAFAVAAAVSMAPDEVSE